MASLRKAMTVLWATGMCVTLAAPAAAQDTAAGVPAAGLRPIEISIGGAGVLSWPTSGGSVRAMIAIPIGDRRSIEIFGGPYVGAINDDLVGGIRASYGFQFTRRLDRGLGPDVEVFISSGAEGLVLRDQAYDCYGPGCGPHDRTYVLPPIIGMFGVGVQKAFSPHCALRIEAHGLFALVVPLGVRAGVSLSIPLGQVYRTSSKAARR